MTDGEQRASVEGLGADLDEIKQKAREEGQVNLVIWAGYADKSWASAFTQQTGCKVSPRTDRAPTTW